MYTGTVIEVFGTLSIFLIEIAFCSELFQYIELESYRNKVGNVNIIEQFDLTEYPVICWRFCHRNSQCTSYFVNNVTGKCYIAASQLTEEQVEEENGWKYFVKTPIQVHAGTSCPTELGYTYDAGTTLCMKLLNRMYRFQAVGNCTKDGGRLLQIKNAEQQEALVNYMQTFHPTSSPLIDGMRPNNDGVWTFEDSEVLTYFKWAANEPAVNNMCIKVSKGSGNPFDWKAAYCSVKNLHLCEIP